MRGSLYPRKQLVQAANRESLLVKVGEFVGAVVEVAELAAVQPESARRPNNDRIVHIVSLLSKIGQCAFRVAACGLNLKGK